MEINHHEIGRDPLYKIWHCLGSIMILYVHNGEGSIVFRDRIYPMKSGTMCLIGPRKQLYTMPSAPAVYDRSKIYISEEMMQELLHLLVQNGSSHRLFADNEVIYAEIPAQHRIEVEKIYTQAQESLEQDAPEIFIACFLRLMHCLKQYVKQQIALPDDLMSQAVAYINLHYTRQLTLEDICDAVHTSKFHFCRRFRKTMGMTVMEYLLKTRLAAAKELLLSSSLPVGTVAESCGFSSVSYFCQVFRSSTGMTANQFKKSGRET